MNRFFLKRRAVRACVLPAVFSVLLCILQIHTENQYYASSAFWRAEKISELLDVNTEESWKAALLLWEKGDKKKAADLFAQVSQSKNASLEERSAGAYWASRAYENIGDERSSWEYKEIASKNTHSFYGLLAKADLGLRPNLNWNKPVFTKQDKEIILKSEAGQRAMSFVSEKKFDRAESELLKLDYKNQEGLKEAVLSYALSMDLPSVSLFLAERVNSKDGRLYDSAFYPLSAWLPSGGYRVDQSLVHAIIRQESRFQISAQSERGAGGLMQVMPKTARYIAEKLGYENDLEHMKPEVNLRLGQDYLLYLFEDEAVQGDVISMLIAYNAGPGNLRKWQKQAGEDVLKDPLLFIETLPAKETREYVKSVMMNYMIYRDRAGQPMQSLSELSSGKGMKFASFSAGREEIKTVASAK